MSRSRKRGCESNAKSCNILPVAISAILVFYLWLIFKATQPDLPSPSSPLRFYSNQTRHDIKSLFCHALERSQESIYLSVYSITDPEVISLLEDKAKKSIPVKVEFDPSASSPLKKLLPHAQVLPIHSKGLMHQKIILIDGHTLFLGSANLTSSSLRHHHNLVLGLYHPALGAFLQNPCSPSFAFTSEEQTGELFLLPDPEQQGLKRLLKTLDSAQTRIRVAMFTFTHPKIAQALIAAHQRGVDVAIAIDAYTAKGASRKTIETLYNQGVKVYLSQGMELLHYKCGWVDGTTLIMGSANWTQSAFTKNQDFLLFLNALNQKQNKFLNSLWEIIEIESNLKL